MALREEIELNRDFESKQEELFLAMVYTNQLLEQVSTAFLEEHGLTRTQFNALMIVRDYEEEGIKQFELARRLLINRASVGTLIDKLCRQDLLERKRVPTDRRAYNLALTRKSRALLTKMMPPYYDRINDALGAFSKSETDRALRFLAKFREILNQN